MSGPQDEGGTYAVAQAQYITQHEVPALPPIPATPGQARPLHAQVCTSIEIKNGLVNLFESTNGLLNSIKVVLSAGDQTHGIIVNGPQDAETGTYTVGPTQYITQHEVPTLPPPTGVPPAQSQPMHQQVFESLYF